MKEMIKYNLEQYKKYYPEFQNIFGIKLSEVWIDNLLGFDIVKFDELLEVPDGTSLKEHVLSKYGERAVQVVEALIKTDMPE